MDIVSFLSCFLIFLVIGIVAVLIIFGRIAYSTYNGLVSGLEEYKNQWSQIDVQLRRRHDLITQLVETVKGYMGHERETLEAVISARNQCTVNLEGMDLANVTSTESLMGAENVLTGALSKLMAVSEAYPELKADTSMAKLQEQLIITEDLIASGRQAYNNSCTRFNIFRKKFPQIMFSSIFGFSIDAQLWEIEEDSMRDSPGVKLD